MKVNYLLLLIILWFHQLGALTVVSLGQTCSVAGALRFFNLRHEAYPFDWLVSPFQSLYKVFDDDFKYFLQEPYLTIRQSDRWGILDFYPFHFVHDFPTVAPNAPDVETYEAGHMTGGVLRADWHDALFMVQEKYQRRIERLRALLSSSEKVYFIRYFDMTKLEAIKFRDLLKRKYPMLDFVLIVINQTDNIKVDWQLENIRNFYFDQSNKKLEIWEPLFKTLGLLS